MTSQTVRKTEHKKGAKTLKQVKLKKATPCKGVTKRYIGAYPQVGTKVPLHPLLAASGKMGCIDTSVDGFSPLVGKDDFIPLLTI